MVTRRDYLKYTAAAGAALTLKTRWLQAQEVGALIQRPIPSTGELLPIVGLGSSATFSDVADQDDIAGVRSVLTALVDNGGSVFDTAPVYGAAEQVAGQVVRDLSLHDRLFWATKVNVGRRGGTVEAARAQIEGSFADYGSDVIDLIQVHNIPDFSVQLPILERCHQCGCGRPRRRASPRCAGWPDPLRLGQQRWCRCARTAASPVDGRDSSPIGGQRYRPDLGYSGVCSIAGRGSGARR